SGTNRPCRSETLTGTVTRFVSIRTTSPSPTSSGPVFSSSTVVWSPVGALTGPPTGVLVSVGSRLSAPEYAPHKVGSYLGSALGGLGWALPTFRGRDTAVAWAGDCGSPGTSSSLEGLGGGSLSRGVGTACFLIK